MRSSRWLALGGDGHPSANGSGRDRERRSVRCVCSNLCRGRATHVGKPASPAAARASELPRLRCYAERQGSVDTPADHFKRAVLALPDVRLRVDWLEYHVQTEPASQLAATLDTVIGQSEISEPRAREVLLTIALWVATARDTDLDRLRAAALDGRLLSLQRVIRRVPPSSLAPESGEPRVPDYGAGRELTLGERRNLARRADRHGFDALLRDPHPMVVAELLTNPKTTEDDVVRMAAFRPARASTIEAIARTRWLTRGRVRMSVLLNPGSPPRVALPLVGLCTRAELLQIARGADVPTILRITAGELIERRPPVFSEEPEPPESGERLLQ